MWQMCRRANPYASAYSFMFGVPTLRGSCTMMAPYPELPPGENIGYQSTGLIAMRIQCLGCQASTLLLYFIRPSAYFIGASQL